MKNNHNPSWLLARIRSFACAFEGLWYAFRVGRNFQLQLMIAFVVVAMGLYLEVSCQEWCWLVGACFAVLVAEVFNSSIEELADIVKPEYDSRIKRVKDMAAAAVLLVALAALIVGLLVFLPKIATPFKALLD